jgi:transposase
VRIIVIRIYTMRVDYCKSVQRGKTYVSILIRHAVRIDGKVKHQTIANLTKMPPEEIEAIEWALKNKGQVSELKNMNFKRTAGKKFGSIYLINETLKKLGIAQALGDGRQGKLAKLQIITRVIEQGSCLSAARIAQENALSEVLGIKEKTSEDDFYKNLAWLTKNQDEIEKKIFESRNKGKKQEIFLYDVTSSYFEGKRNELAEFGYNRDRKNGKKQLVAGLLCDEDGVPFSIRLFKGNTLDFKTVSEQIKKISEDFGCQRVSFVGDRGMIKSKQIEELEGAGFDYITAITKPQIETLLKEGVLQIGLFDREIREIEHEGVRYILKKNPYRAEEIRVGRESKKRKIAELAKLKNKYLLEHKKASSETALKDLGKKIRKLKIDAWLRAEIKEEGGREIELKEDGEGLLAISKLDGCYVIKSNLPRTVDAETIHGRYKDLKYVEQGFKTLKTENLEIRPWFVRLEESTRGKALIAMLAYMVIKHLRGQWRKLDYTVAEGINILDSLRLLEVYFNDKIKYCEVPKLNKTMMDLAKLADVKFPDIFAYCEGNVYNRKKLVRDR